MCGAPAPLPLGPNSVVFHGEALHFNEFCQPWPGCESPTTTVLSSGPLRIQGFLVDTADFRFVGTDAQLTAYRNVKQGDYGPEMDDYWQETSFGNVGVELEISDQLFPLSGSYLIPCIIQ